MILHASQSLDWYENPIFPTNHLTGTHKKSNCNQGTMQKPKQQLQKKTISLQK